MIARHSGRTSGGACARRAATFATADWKFSTGRGSITKGGSDCGANASHANVPIRTINKMQMIRMAILRHKMQAFHMQLRIVSQMEVVERRKDETENQSLV
jgi:hypothetical protein